MSVQALLARCDAALVDLDGTLVDTLDDFAAALDATLDALALPRVPREAIAQMVGKGTEHLVNSALNQALRYESTPFDATKKEALLAQALAFYHQHYPAINGRYSRVYPGVPQGLQALHARGLRLACLTNKPAAFATALLHAKGLHGFFEQVFGGDSFARKKPDPLPLLGACAALGTAPARTLMIGDSRNDAQAAHGAGCPLLLVTYGYNHGQPAREVPADAYLDTLAALA